MATHVREGSDIPVLPAGSSTRDWRLGRLSPMPPVVPPLWELVPILTVARLESGHTPSRRIPEYWEGHIPWVSLHDSKTLGVAEICETSQTIGELGLANSSARLLPAGTVVFSRTATVGKSTILGRDMATSQDFANFVCGPRLHNQYLMQLFRCLQPEWARLMAGSTHNTIYMPVFRDLQLLLPPLPEQRKIAAILSSVDETIEKTEAVIAQLQIVKKAMMQELLTRGMPGRHTRFKQTEIGEIPESWEMRRLDDVAFVQTGIAKGKVVGADATPVPYLRVANVQDGHIDLSEVKSIDVTPEQIARFGLRVGDVLFCEGGDADKVGRGDVWQGQVDPCLHQNHVFAVRPDTEVLLPEFLSAVRASEVGKRYFLDCAKQTTNLASINSTQLKAFPVPLPGLDEQRAIVDALASITVQVELETAVLARLRATKESAAAALLSGELRVTPAEGLR